MVESLTIDYQAVPSSRQAALQARVGGLWLAWRGCPDVGALHGASGLISGAPEQG
jgi:hypothetical protein